jgi:hypothetical protein
MEKEEKETKLSLEDDSNTTGDFEFICVDKERVRCSKKAAKMSLLAGNAIEIG